VKRVSTLAVVALLLLAGCGGQAAPSTKSSTTETVQPTSTTTASPTYTSEPAVEVEERGASLGDVNASLVWERVGGLVSVDSAVTPKIVVNPGPTAPSSVSYNEFYDSLGANWSEFTGVTGSVDAKTYRDGTVWFWVGPNATSADIEATLAHEFAHVYQTGIDAELGWDASLSRNVVSEGTAELVTFQYTDRYMPSYSEEEQLEAGYRNSKSLRRLAYVPYLYGARYARNVSDGDEPMVSMYENPPNTSEQLLHGLDPSSEPPKPLTTHGRTNGTWVYDETPSPWGEASLRYVLQMELSEERAARAAAGWGNDRRMTFSHGDERGYAWVLRWDSPSEAQEFESAWADYEANVSEPLRLVGVGEETTVVLAGNRTFVESATVSGTNGNVTVSTAAKES
jgi:hypothetical protein